MPKFNTNNPTNIYGASMEAPEDILFNQILKDMTRKGCNEINVNELQNKHSSSQLKDVCSSLDNLLEWFFDELVNRITIAYEDVLNETLAYIEKTGTTKDDDIIQLQRFLSKHIYLSFHPKNIDYVLLVNNESILPEKYKTKVAQVITRMISKPLSLLIYKVAEIKKMDVVSMISLSVCSGIAAFVTQPKLRDEIFAINTGNKCNMTYFEDQLNGFFVRSILINTSIFKPY